MDELTGADLALPERHLERVEDKVGAQVVSELPSDDPAGEHIEDELRTRTLPRSARRSRP